MAAFAWLTRQERGFTTREARAFDHWMGADVRHEGAFIRAVAARGWFARHAAHHRMQVGARAFAPPRSTGLYLSRRQALWMTLSGVCATTVGCWSLMHRETQGERLATAIGQVWSGHLRDGSTIVMNTGTELFVNLTSAHRDIHVVHGEMFLRGVPGSVKPLLVYAGSCMVRVLGAALSIRQQSERTTVTAIEGGVEILSRDSVGLKQILAAHQRATVSSGGIVQLSELSAEEISQELAWREGLLVYPNTPLREVLADFGRYVSHRYTCGDESVCERRLVGVFDIKKPDAFIAVLTSTFDLEAVTTGNHTVLESRAPKPEPAQ